MGKRILIIKLAAMGDVLRTTPIITPLKEKYPNSHITWIVDRASYDLLKRNKHIDRLMDFTPDNRMQLEVEEFDILLCLDKDIRAATLAMRVNAHEKKGFGLSRLGNIFPLNLESEYAFELGINDDLKFRLNKKSYQEIIFEAVGFKYHHEPYQLCVEQEEDAYAANVLKQAGVKDNSLLIGICPGAGPLFANKGWTIEGYAELIDSLNQIEGVQVILLGGQAEIDKNSKIKSLVRTRLLDAQNHHSVLQFSAIISRCQFIVCGDTLPMHLAIGHGKHVLVLMGPTCPQEIELYGRGEIIMSAIECAPCYKRSCDIIEHCMVRIPAGLVFEKARNIIQTKLKC